MTPIASGALIFRLFYIPLSSKSCDSFNTVLKIIAKMQNAIGLYMFFMLCVAGVLACLSIQFESNHGFVV